jgi:hypothetical protein
METLAALGECADAAEGMMGGSNMIAKTVVGNFMLAP